MKVKNKNPTMETSSNLLLSCAMADRGQKKLGEINSILMSLEIATHHTLFVTSSLFAIMLTCAWECTCVYMY
jgi:hypothetical protein